MSPDAAESPTTGPGVGTGKVAGTQRKCANCGQVGHIKTNKKWVCSHCSHTNSPSPPHVGSRGRGQDRNNKNSTTSNRNQTGSGGSNLLFQTLDFEF